MRGLLFALLYTAKKLSKQQSTVGSRAKIREIKKVWSCLAVLVPGIPAGSSLRVFWDLFAKSQNKSTFCRL